MPTFRVEVTKNVNGAEVCIATGAFHPEVRLDLHPPVFPDEVLDSFVWDLGKVESVGTHTIPHDGQVYRISWLFDEDPSSSDPPK